VRIDLIVHIIAGSIGILAGFVALSVAKGGTRHRTVGRIFVYAMIPMALMGAMIAAMQQVAPGLNIPVGLLTAYLVATALTTVRPPSTRSHLLDLGFLLVAACVALTFYAFGFRVAASPTGKLYGVPAVPFFIFGSIAMLATLGDVRLVRSGGVRAIRGVPRLVRHLWRMCVALLIAAFSFFIG
jgi:uncharacterized membrane protein